MVNKIACIKQLITLSAIVGITHGGGSQESGLLVHDYLSSAISLPATAIFSDVATVCDIKT